MERRAETVRACGASVVACVKGHRSQCSERAISDCMELLPKRARRLEAFFTQRSLSGAESGPQCKEGPDADVYHEEKDLLDEQERADNDHNKRESGSPNVIP